MRQYEDIDGRLVAVGRNYLPWARWPAMHLPERIEYSGMLFSRMQFSKIGIPPGTTEKILREPEKYWRKKDDGDRTYWIPMGPLEKIHAKFARLLSREKWRNTSGCATAYWSGSSTIKNGRPHKHNHSSIVLDVRHAFESIRTKHIQHYLMRTGLMLRGPYGFPHDRAQAWLISRLLTHHGRLRQGSPASPFVFNLLFERLDAALVAALREFGDVVYTRYADDLCFSSSRIIFPVQVEEVVRRVLREQHVELNERKTKRSNNSVLELSGIAIVRGQIRPNGDYIAKIAQTNDLSERSRQGHLDFLNQFGRGAVPRIVKEALR